MNSWIRLGILIAVIIVVCISGAMRGTYLAKKAIRETEEFNERHGDGSDWEDYCNGD